MSHCQKQCNRAKLKGFLSVVGKQCMFSLSEMLQPLTFVETAEIFAETQTTTQLGQGED